MRRLAIPLVFVLGGGAGFWLARGPASRPPAAPAPAPQPPVAPPGPVRAEVTLDAGPLQAELRAAVREELRALRGPGPGPAAKAVEPAPADARASSAAPASPGANVAFEGGRRLVSSAQAARRWRREDAAELRELLPRMSESQRHQLLEQLLPAINRGEIVPEGNAFPL